MKEEKREERGQKGGTNTTRRGGEEERKKGGLRGKKRRGGGPRTQCCSALQGSTGTGGTNGQYVSSAVTCTNERRSTKDTQDTHTLAPSNAILSLNWERNGGKGEGREGKVGKRNGWLGRLIGHIKC